MERIVAVGFVQKVNFINIEPELKYGGYIDPKTINIQNNLSHSLIVNSKQKN
jgi:hypothetical protein